MAARPHAFDAVDALRSLIDRPGWQARAACRGMGPDRFFAVDADSRQEAARLCGGCPVRQECAAAARPSLRAWGGADHGASGGRGVCAVCGVPLPEVRRGTRPVTCSEPCKRERTRQQDRARRDARPRLAA
jgi:hypothetical protein